MDLADRYAELAVRVGINLQPGQDVHIVGAVEHAPLARRLAAQCYRAGARRVQVEYDDAHVRKAAIEHGPIEALTTHYAWELEVPRNIQARGGCLIAITGDPSPGLMEGLDPAKVAARDPERSAAWVGVVDSVQWLVLGAPTEGWARSVFGEPDMERLWQAIAFTNRLDETDPVAAWRDHLAMLAARGRALDALQPAAIRFRGPGTDLTLPMLQGQRYLAGVFPREDGIAFVPNLPTEEVYGTPIRGRGDGVVRATKPLPMGGGTLVEGLVLTIRDGRVVGVEADTNADLVRRDLERDPGASYLGEVSIVDAASRVLQSGLVFRNTLYDENAGCHIAYGRAYETTFPGADRMTDEEKIAAGLNVSSVHTDVVIGGPEVEVDALGADGAVTPLLRDNVFQLALE